MGHFRIPAAVLTVVFVGVGWAAISQASEPSAMAPKPSSRDTWPADVDRHSGFRLPLPKREDLDEAGQRIYDRFSVPGTSIAGLQGPNGVQLFSPKIAPQLTGINNYLRREAGISPRLREIAILTTARELDSQFEWTAHEREALKEGVPQTTIDAVKFRKSLDGLDSTDALVIELGRQLWHEHKLSAQAFATAKAAFGPNKLVDIILLMANYAGTAAVLTAVDMQLHEGETPLLPIP